MTDEVMKRILVDSTGVTDESTLTDYLSMAQDIVLTKAFPFKDTSSLSVPSQYQHVQVNVAAYLLNKRGAEGETEHSENGVTRKYEAGSVPPSLLKEITPEAKGIAL